MGFAAIATTTAAVLPHVLSAVSGRQEGKALNKAADAQEKLYKRQADAMVDTAARNASLAARNANDRLAGARAEAGAANLADEGSVRVREMDLATRLEHEISNNTNAALQQANSTREQGMLQVGNMRNTARQAQSQGIGSLFESFGSLIGGIGNKMKH